MSYGSLRDFIARLERGEPAGPRVGEPVSPVLEMTEIQTRLLAEQAARPSCSRTSVREDGTRHAMPALANLFGTVERVAWGMEREPGQLREIGETLAFLRQPEPPGGWREAMGMLPLLKTVMAMKPRTVVLRTVPGRGADGRGYRPCALPIQTCWPGEPAPLITWPLVVTQGPTGKREDAFNLGIYRMQVTGPDTTLMRWLKHRGGAQHHARWKASRSPSPSPPPSSSAPIPAPSSPP